MCASDSVCLLDVDNASEHGHFRDVVNVALFSSVFLLVLESALRNKTLFTPLAKSNFCYTPEPYF